MKCTYNQNVLCGLEEYVEDLINFGTSTPSGQVSSAMWLGSCMNCLHTTPELANCTQSLNGTLNEKDWDQQGLRDFLSFLNTRSVRFVDIWTRGAAPQDGKFCAWEFEELQR